MALMTPEPFCTAELWSLLELLPYKVRFEVYDAAQVGSYTLSSEVPNLSEKIGAYRNLGKKC